MDTLTLYHRDIPIVRETLEDDKSAAAASLERGDRIVFGDWAVVFEKKGAASPSCSRGASSAGRNGVDEFGLVGTSTFIRALRLEICRCGPLRAPVLITGDSGTGKELIARGLHAKSAHSKGPFVAVNCGGLTESLLEDTLFGHERGAFTGALASKKGLFEQASGGTLFLDEIGELGLREQASLLRVLEGSSVQRIGGEREIDVNFRLVAATNRDLGRLIEEGSFRLDLFHRLSALTVKTLPLHKRPEDVEELSHHFLRQFAEELGARRISQSAVRKLKARTWPGNVRELRNALYRAAAMSVGPVLDEADFDFRRTDRRSEPRVFRLEDVPDSVIGDLLAQHKGNVAAAARELGVPRTTLRDRLRRSEHTRLRQRIERSAPFSLAS